MKESHRSGFSIVEITIAVTIIGFLAGIAIPSFMRSRKSAQATFCVNNMWKMESAKDQWALETFKSNGDPCDFSDIVVYFKNGLPVCPANGAYTINPIGSNATCSISEQHALK